MNFENTQKLLHDAQDFHRFLSDRCARMSAEADTERLRMVLDYMQRQNEHLADALQKFEKEGGAILNNTWFQYSPENGPEVCFSQIKKLPESTSPDDLITRVIDLQECLGGFYSEAARLAPNEPVRHLFQSLHRQSVRGREELMTGVNLTP